MGFASEAICGWDQLVGLNKVGWLYRGQRCEDWGLAPSLERCLRREEAQNDAERIERLLFREFRRVYHQFGRHVPDADSWMEWNSLMQHHFAPTRLLDFTYSFFVAVYFAVEDADGSSAVWGVNRKWMRNASCDLLKEAGRLKADICGLYDKETAEEREKTFRKLFMEGEPVQCVSVVTPFRLNERLRAQKGTFLMPGDIRKSFVANLEAMSDHDDRNNVCRLVIPKLLRREILEKLHYMNISRTSLFPGLDGYAQSLKVYHPDYDRDPDKDKVVPPS